MHPSAFFCRIFPYPPLRLWYNICKSKFQTWENGYEIDAFHACTILFATLALTPFAHAEGDDPGEEPQEAVTETLPRPDPAIAEFARGVKFTVAGYNGGSEVQTNFPVLVRLSESTITGFHYSDFYADGSDLSRVDIGFVDAAGNGLAYEIDTWNTNGVSLVWVNLPA